MKGVCCFSMTLSLTMVAIAQCICANEECDINDEFTEQATDELAALQVRLNSSTRTTRHSSYVSVGNGQCADEDGELVQAYDDRSIGWAYGGKRNGEVTNEMCQEVCSLNGECGAFAIYHGFCWLYAKIGKPYVKTNTKYRSYECFVKVSK
mmetsp:Transcript_44054/g.79242  ORF Transcript_44054/g.79242 Transcript_44054/m.79242 type:complete len:151 (-) Transcript_44054:287-739(-)